MILGAAERGQLEAVMRTRVFPDGAEIVSHLDRTADVFLLVEGRVSIVIHAEDGTVVDFAEAGPGEIFGEIAAIDGGPRSASVVARGAVEAGVIARADFLALLELPAFARAVNEHFARQVRALNERVVEFSTLLVRERLVRELLRRAPEGAPSAEIRLSPMPTHFDLAARISTHREAVSREMSRLAKLGVVQRLDGALVIQSREALESLLGR